MSPRGPTSSTTPYRRRQEDGPEPVVDGTLDDLEADAHRDLFDLVDSLADAATRDRYLSGPALEGMQAENFPRLPEEHVGKLFERLMGKSADDEGAAYIRSKVEG